MIKSILNKSEYTTLFKISQIHHQLKPDKNPLNPDSYRPINNLPVLEKLCEEYVLDHFVPFLEDNKVIHLNHHGGLKLHSPETAMTEIKLALAKNLDNNLISVLLTTDLSAAYDTVDHCSLLRKLEYYGIRGKTLNSSNLCCQTELNMYKLMVQTLTHSHPETIL